MKILSKQNICGKMIKIKKVIRGNLEPVYIHPGYVFNGLDFLTLTIVSLSLQGKGKYFNILYFICQLSYMKQTV